MTSEDVKFTLEMYRDNPDFPYQSSYPDVFTTIEAPDPTTVTLTSAEPVGNFEYRMAYMYVLPKHIWENEDPLTFENLEMIGTGSFKIVEYTQNEFVRLEAVKDHWNIAPNVDEVVFQTISNPDARVAALTNGRDRRADRVPGSPPSSTLQGTENVQVVERDLDRRRLRDVFFNLVDPADCPEGGRLLRPSGAPGVRGAPGAGQGHRQAADHRRRDAGHRELGRQHRPDRLGRLLHRDRCDWAFDVEAANAQLDDAGYADTDGDGVRECKAGQDCDEPDIPVQLPR